MCGFAGILSADKVARSRTKIAAMLLQHRGPDEERFYECEDYNVAFRRLAIIDIATSSQPIENERFVLTFNGEIYNYLELKESWLKGKYNFKTTGDAEVILAGYTIYGCDFFKRLNGIFAFAIYDKSTKRVVLCRDPAGVKPLFYRKQFAELTFASELNALLGMTDCKFKLDEEALRIFLSTGYIPAPWTIYQGISSLEPGTYLVRDKLEVKIVRYWNEEKTEAIPTIEMFEDQLQKAIKQQLMSERPLGIFLSGGVDSSLITLGASRERQLDTFTAVIEDEEWNEQAYANQIVSKVGSKHNEVHLSGLSSDLIEGIIHRYGQPFADASMVPTYLVSQLVRSKGVVVVLAGDGSDEMYCGYEYRYNKAIENKSTDNRAFFDEHYVRVPCDLSAGYLTSNFSVFEAFSKKIDTSSQSKVDLMRKFDSRFFLEGDILQKVDIASMAHSLEVRVPFLSQDLMRLVAQMPSSLLVDQGCSKKLWKEILAKQMSKEFVYRKKVGLQIPLKKWIDVLLEGIGSNDPIWNLPIIRTDRLQALLESRKRRKLHNITSNFLFFIYVLNVWLKRNIKSIDL